MRSSAGTECFFAARPAGNEVDCFPIGADGWCVIKRIAVERCARIDNTDASTRENVLRREKWRGKKQKRKNERNNAKVHNKKEMWNMTHIGDEKAEEKFSSAGCWESYSTIIICFGMAFVKTSQPVSVSQTSSSIRTPQRSGRYTPGSIVMTAPTGAISSGNR